MVHFNGSIEIMGEGKMSYFGESGYNEYTSDEGMFSLFKKMQKEGQNAYHSNHFLGGNINPENNNKVAKSKEIEEIPINVMKYNSNPNIHNPIYWFVEKGDIIYLDSTEIQKIIF